MRTLIRHPYHLVEESPWPILGAAGGILLTRGLVKWLHFNELNLFFTGNLALGIVMLQWWRDVSIEGSLIGLHTKIVELGLRWGMALFIISEIFFFLRFFWAFYHRSLAPAVEIGNNWPPMGIQPFNPFQVPLLNTIILLSSGIRVTWAHHRIIEHDHSNAIQGLIWTVGLGVFFTALQALEYVEASYRMADRVYGSTFFIATGFHGLHVIVGTTFLTVCLVRQAIGHYRAAHHFGFEAAAWYWHFVDVVWLFLFISIYWWGGN